MLSSHPEIFTYWDQAVSSGMQRPQPTDHGPRLRDQGANVCSTMHCWVTLASPCPSVSLSLAPELRLVAWKARQPRSDSPLTSPRAPSSCWMWAAAEGLGGPWQFPTVRRGRSRFMNKRQKYKALDVRRPGFKTHLCHLLAM